MVDAVETQFPPADEHHLHPFYSDEVDPIASSLIADYTRLSPQLEIFYLVNSLAISGNMLGNG
ncbi:MAG: hypothetical protein LKI94_01930 [Sporolactobacillus sp.]|jgi:hypothetical protein|nr:hypothetical protein [Sporolactobacillus sp.]